MTTPVDPPLSRATEEQLLAEVARRIPDVVITQPPVTQPPTQPPVTQPPVDTSLTPGTPVFVGDYSTGDFSQWPVVQNKNYNGAGRSWTPNYSAAIINDSAKGKAARFEVRDGDKPSWSAGERSQVQGPDSTGGPEGSQMWFQFSLKFDPSFPKDHRDVGWAITNGWHPNSPTGSSPFQWALHWQNGYWSLLANLQSAPGVYEKTICLWQTPMGSDWHDVIMHVYHSTSDSKGWIKLWHNGTRQTFTNGKDVYNVRTIVPQTTGSYYKEGLYREASATATAILYCSKFRCGRL